MTVGRRVARTLGVALGAGLVAAVCRAADAPPADERYRESYSLGYEFGASLRRQQIEVDAEVLLAAVRAALAGREPALPPGEVRETLVRLRKKAIVAEDLRFRQRAAKGLEEGRAFLAENAARAGVTTRPSGLQYLVLREGSGPSPKRDELVKVHYRGALVDGTEFDGTLGGEPAIVEPGEMIEGWAEALPLMTVGAKWRLFVPAQLGYGDRPFGRVPPNSALIFDVELLGVGDGLLSEREGPGDEACDDDARAGEGSEDAAETEGGTP